MTVTELATISLLPGSDISDKGSDVAARWKFMCDTVTPQKGCESIFYGPEHENPDVAQLFVNWESLDSHKAFMATPEYKPMLKHIDPILSGPLHMLHYEFDAPGNLKAALSAPLTELATFYVSVDKRASFDSIFEPFRKTLAEHADGYVGMSYGWSVEDVEHENFEAKEKGKACLCAIGWQSFEAHMAFRETDAFKNSIGPMRDIPKGAELHHTAIKKEQTS